MICAAFGVGIAGVAYESIRANRMTRRPRNKYFFLRSSCRKRGVVGMRECPVSQHGLTLPRIHSC